MRAIGTTPLVKSNLSGPIWNWFSNGPFHNTAKIFMTLRSSTLVGFDLLPKGQTRVKATKKEKPTGLSHFSIQCTAVR
jgi:hypothetical protein